MGHFDDDTAITRGGDHWVGEVSNRWLIGSNPNGGYLLAMVARAMLADSRHPDPWTVTAHYMSPPAVGPVEIRTSVIKPGRTYATVSGELHQQGRERVRVLGAFGDLSARRGPSRVVATMPDVPPPDDCMPRDERVAPGAPLAPEVTRRFDVRVPPDAPWGRHPGDAPFEVTGWIRFADGTEPSALGLLLLADAFPPTVIGGIDVGWVPTIELTTHVRARPAPGWVLGTFRTRFLIDGMMEEDGELWDSEGRLVALSRQLAMALPRG